MEDLDSLGSRCVIIDAAIDGASGYQLCRQLTRDRPEGPAVILLASFGDADRALGVGAAAFLGKPVRRAALHQVLDELCGPPQAPAVKAGGGSEP